MYRCCPLLARQALRTFSGETITCDATSYTSTLTFTLQKREAVSQHLGQPRPSRCRLLERRPEHALSHLHIIASIMGMAGLRQGGIRRAGITRLQHMHTYATVNNDKFHTPLASHTRVHRRAAYAMAHVHVWRGKETYRGKRSPNNFPFPPAGVHTHTHTHIPPHLGPRSKPAAVSPRHRAPRGESSCAHSPSARARRCAVWGSYRNGSSPSA